MEDPAAPIFSGNKAQSIFVEHFMPIMVMVTLKVPLLFKRFWFLIACTFACQKAFCLSMYLLPTHQIRIFCLSQHLDQMPVEVGGLLAPPPPLHQHQAPPGLDAAPAALPFIQETGQYCKLSCMALYTNRT